MSKILLWVFSIFFIVMSLGFVTISFIASILFLIAGAYLNPIVRSKFLARLENSPLLGKKVGFAFVSILLAIGVFKVFDDENTASVKKAVVSYQSNPADFILKINKNAEDKKFYLSIAELDRIIPSIPDDQVLKNLRHEITIAEIKFNASEEKLYLFDDKNLAKYKEIMGATSNENDIFKTYTDLASSYIAKEETSKAKEVIKNLIKIAPNNSAVGEITERIASVDKKIKEREAAIAKEKVEEEAAEKKSVAPAELEKGRMSPEATTVTTGVQPESYYTNLTNFEIGICVGYLSVESKKLGWENMHKGHIKYTKRNLRYLEKAGEITRNFPECSGKGVDHIIQCLDSKGFAAEEIALVLGANTGIANKDVSARNAMAMACMDI
jgi:tetratricopeptide (TPR) repeat protein